jgi:hypothetical protein
MSFNILKGIDRIELDSIVGKKSGDPPYETIIHPRNLTKKQVLPNPRLHSFRLRVIDQWNTIPDDMTNLEKLNAVKSKLKRE